MGRGDERLKAPLPKEDAVDADGSDQQHRRRHRTRHRTRHRREVHLPHDTVEDVEALLKGQRQEEARQQLNTGLHDAQFLEEAGPVAIQPFGLGLRPRPAIPILVGLGMVDVHVTRSSMAVVATSGVPSASRNKPGEGAKRHCSGEDSVLRFTSG